MKTSVIQELNSYLLDMINDEVLTNENIENHHFHAFNESHYIIGYYQASEWLKKHDLDVFEALNTVVNYEIENFGESTPNKYDNSESTVNMLAYIYGEELLNSLDYSTVEELKELVSE